MRRLFDSASRRKFTPPVEGSLACPETGVVWVREAHPNDRYANERGGCPTHPDCRFKRASLEHQLSDGMKGKHNFKGVRCTIETERTDWQVNKAVPQGSKKARNWKAWLKLVKEYLAELDGNAQWHLNSELYVEALVTTNFDRFSMTVMPTNQILHERTGLAPSTLRDRRSLLELHGWLGLVGGGRSAGCAKSGGNEAQVLVLCIPEWWLEQRRAARRERARGAFYGVVDKVRHPLTSKKCLSNIQRLDDTPEDGRATARQPFGALVSAQARAARSIRHLNEAGYGVRGGPGVPDAIDSLGGDAHRASQAPEKGKGRSSFFDDVAVAGQWLQSHVPALAGESLDRICLAVKAKVKACGWNVTDILDAIEFDPATGQRWRGGGLDLAKYPARLLKWRIDQWGTRTPAGREKVAQLAPA